MALLLPEANRTNLSLKNLPFFFFFVPNQNKSEQIHRHCWLSFLLFARRQNSHWFTNAHFPHKNNFWKRNAGRELILKMCQSLKTFLLVFMAEMTPGGRGINPLNSVCLEGDKKFPGILNQKYGLTGLEKYIIGRFKRLSYPENGQSQC